MVRWSKAWAWSAHWYLGKREENVVFLLFPSYLPFPCGVFLREKNVRVLTVSDVCGFTSTWSLLVLSVWRCGFFGSSNTAGKDGAKYVGQFKNDKKEGQGVYYYPSGAKYTGQWATLHISAAFCLVGS